MPDVIVEEVKGINEIEITIRFKIDNPIEQAFKKSLLDSLTPEKHSEYAHEGNSIACVDCKENKDDTVSIIGLADDINRVLHSPPLQLPEEIKNDEAKLKKFWSEVGDVIWDKGKIDEYRSRDQNNRTVIRSDAHTKLYEEIKIIREHIRVKENLESFVQSILEPNDVSAVRDRLFSRSLGKIFDIDELKTQGIEQHLNYPQFKEKLETLEQEINNFKNNQINNQNPFA